LQLYTVGAINALRGGATGESNVKRVVQDARVTIEGLARRNGITPSQQAHRLLLAMCLLIEVDEVLSDELAQALADYFQVPTPWEHAAGVPFPRSAE
jgi:hypothetical protein